MKAIALAVALSAIAVSASAQNFPQFLGKPVIDGADVLPPADESALNERLIRYNRETGHQMAVVTVTSLEGSDIESYANGLFRHIGVGNRGANDGVMLLMAMEDRETRIEVGYGLEPVLTDAAAASIIQTIIVPGMRAGNAPQAIREGTEAILAGTAMTTEEIASLRDQQALQAEKDAERMQEGFTNFLLSTLALFGIGAGGFGIYYLIDAPRRRRRKREREEATLRYEQACEARRQALEIERGKRARAAEQNRKSALAERVALLAGMTVVERVAYLAEEQRVQDAARKKNEIADQKRRDDSRKRAADDDSYGGYSSSSSSSSSSSDSDSYSSGGGSSGGGGASGSW